MKKIPRVIFVTNKTSIKYLSEFEGTNGFLATVRDKKGKIAKGALFTDSRYHLIAKACLPKHIQLVDITGGLKIPLQKFIKENKVQTLGVDARDVSKHMWDALKKIGGTKVKTVDIENALDKDRIVKRKDELSYIIRAQEITDKILSELRKSLRQGMSEKEISWKIQTMAHDFGADELSFPSIVGINEHSASPHHHPTDKKLKKGDLILIDMGVSFKGYCSDMTRVLFSRAPTPEQINIYELVLLAQETAIKGLRAGITGAAGDKLARDIIKKAGHGDNFGHSLGHGVGMDVHELPNLSSLNKEKLPVGAVVTVEPGVYLEGKFGVRLEDMVIVGEKKVINITKSPKALKDCSIRI